MNTIYALLLCLAGLAVLAGWGELAGLALRVRTPRWPLNLGIGLAALIFLGGVLNASGVAFPWAFDALVSIGIAAAGVTAYRRRRNVAVSEIVSQGAVILAALATVAFYANFLTPVTVFDFLDDFEKYLAYPVRMLGTGTLAGPAINSLLLETAGGGAFLQGFVLAHAPLTWVNLADAVFGLLLCLVTVGGVAAWRGGRAALLALPSVALVVVINPQYANISPLYLSAALVATMVLLAGTGEGGPSPRLAGVLLAALLALKTTMVPFVGAALLALAAATVVVDGPRQALRRAGSLLLWLFLGILPWAVLHRARLTGLFDADNALTEAPIPVPDPGSMDLPALLSFAHLPYGASLAAYTLATMCTLAAGVALITEIRSRQGKVAAAPLSAGALAAVLPFIFIAVMGYSQARDFDQFAVRLLVPTVLGTAVAGLTLATCMGERWSRWISVAASIVLLGVFGSELPERLRHIANGNSLLAFTWLTEKEEYRSFNAQALGSVRRDRLHAIQAKVPEGEPVLNWTTTPFLLDYARNPLVDVDFMGLSAPWARAPQAHYVLWEYRGYAVRGMDAYEKNAHLRNANASRAGRRGLALARHLQALAARSPVLYADREFVLFRTEEPLTPKP